ncbi:MAG: hypothetical protein JRJ77_18240 [Deltaproteobacteria bacterium]|nr:hypothetical protein [Deltaproteobacteria bacterium]
MEILMQIFAPMIVFVYHCFDRIDINGYISMLSRPENVVYFFHNVLGQSCITKEILGSRTKHYNQRVEAYAHNHDIPIEWAEKNVRKEDYVRPKLKAMKRGNRFGVYFILKSMEQGSTFRSVAPKYPTKDQNYRLIKKTRSRFTHYYFFIRDEVLGPMSIRVASYLPFQTTCYLNGHSFIEQELLRSGTPYRKDDNAFVSVKDVSALQSAADRLSPQIIRGRIEYWTLIVGPKFSKREQHAMNLRRFYAISQIEYCHNFVFRRSFPIRKLFERSCELGFFSMTAKKVSNIFGWRITHGFKGKLQTVLERINQAHHTFRAYFKNSYVKQYEKLRTFLRMEVCSNHLPDLRIKKSLDNLDAVRHGSTQILDRFATIQAQTLNAHFDFPLLQRLSLPVLCKNTTIAGIKIHNTRMIRLMEVLMHAGMSLNGWSSRTIHDLVVEAFQLPHYTLTQLRYDLRKMKAHGLIERNGKQYSYLLTEKGVKVATMFVLFHKRLCGPLANSLFNHRPNKFFMANGKLEKAYHKADDYIEKITELLAA